MGEPSFRCDFCGGVTRRVRRVALDRDYDRLSLRHSIRYACEACSRRKETERAAPGTPPHDVDARRGGP